MKIQNLLILLLLAIFAVSCSDADVNNGGGNNNEGGEVVEPPQPSEPAYIKLDSNCLFTDYDGGKKSVVVDATPEMEWDITSLSSLCSLKNGSV